MVLGGGGLLIVAAGLIVEVADSNGETATGMKGGLVTVEDRGCADGSGALLNKGCGRGCGGAVAAVARGCGLTMMAEAGTGTA